MFLFFDTETTGIPINYKAPATDLSNWPRLVQLAYLVCNGQGEIVITRNYIIKPVGFIIPKDSSDVHGITTEKALTEGCDLKQVLEEFISYVQNANYLIAHNMAFDEKIVGAELIRMKFSNIIESKNRLCTMLASVDFCAMPGKHGYKWPKLSELHLKLFGSKFDDAHNALADIEATAKCFWELKAKGILHVSIDNIGPLTKDKIVSPKNENSQTSNISVEVNSQQAIRLLTQITIDYCKKQHATNNIFDFDELALSIYHTYMDIPDIVASYIKVLPAIVIDVLNNNEFGEYFREKGVSIDEMFDLKSAYKLKETPSIIEKYSEKLKQLRSTEMNRILQLELNLDNLVSYLSLCFPDRKEMELHDVQCLLYDLETYKVSFKELFETTKRVAEYLPLIEQEEYRYDSKNKKSTQIGIVRVILYVTNLKFLKDNDLPGTINIFYLQWQYIIESGKKAAELSESDLPRWTYIDFDFDLLLP